MKTKHGKTALLLLLFSLHIACNSDDIRSHINKAGEMAGETAGGFAAGVSSGVGKAFEMKVTLSDSLKAAGLSLGKVSMNDSAGNDNILTVYMIFSRDFSNTITAKVFDKENVEMGRVKTKVEKMKEEAGFVDFHFDPRTNMDSDCKVILE